jgi:hypothetical protein
MTTLRDQLIAELDTLSEKQQAELLQMVHDLKEADKRYGIKEVIGDKRDQIIAIAAKYGVVNLRVFGSVARGEATRDSDLDLLVEFTQPMSLFRIAAVQNEISDLIGREVDLIKETNLIPRARRTAEADLVAL